MKRFVMMAVAGVCLAAVPAWATAPEPTPLKTTITAVTAYADRAQVTRAAKIGLQEAPRTWVIEGLPGWIDHESVRATLSPASAGQLVDVRIDKTFLVEPSAAGVRDATRALQEVQDQLAAIGDEEAVVRNEIAQIEAMRAFTMDKLPKDMVTRDVKVRTLSDTLTFIGERLRASRSALRDLSKQRRALQPTLDKRNKELAALQAQARLEQRRILVEAKGRGKATLTLSYLLPGATWEPMSELRVSDGGRAVSLVQVASVTQSTGEDWDGATLTFSTQRPTETLSVPEVSALLLGGDGAGLNKAVSRASASFAKAQSTYSSQIAIANRDVADWAQTQSRQASQQARAQQTFDSLAKRGTTAHFDALASRVVRADGNAVRVPIASADLTAEVRLVAVPEVSLNVVRTAALTNTSEQSILPGRSSLYVNGAFVGTSELPFVAPGESFSTFLGVHDRVKLERRIDRKRSTYDRGRKRTTVRASFLITAENLGDTPVTLELGDRVPVVQNDDIELDDVKTPKGAKRDRDGVVKWTATVAEKKLTWRIEYEIEYPNDFLDRIRSQPAKPAARKRLMNQIDFLEDNLR